MVNIIKTFRPVNGMNHKPSRMVCVWCLLIGGFFCLTAATNTASAAIYYVDAVNGDDSNPGTSAAPWRTIAKAESSVVNGSTVYLHSGNYGGVSINTTGLNRLSWADGVTYMADLGHTPVFDQLSITGFENRYLTFKNINIIAPSDSTFGSVLFIKDSSHIKIINCNVTGRWNAEGDNTTNPIVYIDSTRQTSNYITDILIDGCDIQQGYKGVIIAHDSRDITVRNSHIHWISSSFISIDKTATENSIIENNHLHDRRKTPGAHGSGIALHASNVVIRGNRIHDYGGSGGIRFYGSGGVAPEGHENIVIENNLVYDAQGTTHMYFGNIWRNITIRNNTFLGWYYPSETYKYKLVAIFKPEVGTPGYASNVFIYNNIFVGAVEIWSEASINFDEDNNIFWALNTGSGFRQNPLGENSIIIVGDSGFNPGYDTNYFEGSGNFFIGGADFDKYSYTRLLYLSGDFVPGSNFRVGEEVQQDTGRRGIARGIVRSYTTDQIEVIYHGGPNFRDGISVFGVTSGAEIRNATVSIYVFPHKQNLNDGYQLAAGSPAIGFADPAHAPATDILGNPRGANPDAGCYEYVSSDPNNPTPELQAIGNKSVNENVTLTFDVNATDPNGDPITFSAQGLPSGATLDQQTGDFTWKPSYEQQSSDDPQGDYEVTFIASDGNSQDSEKITITVNNVNRPPILGSITDQSVDENSILSLSVEASDPDGQVLTYSVSGLPAGAVFVSQTLTWTPSYDQAGAYPVTFTADDGQAQDSEAITITVINVNRTPVLTAINNQSVWADDPLTFTIDAIDPDGDTVTYSASNLPTGATFTGQDFDWTPSQGQMGSYDVTFIASDGQLQDSQMVTITVDVDSLAPTVTNLSPAVGAIQVPLNNLITLNIADAGKGVNAKSVKIKVKTNSNPNNNTIYFGDTDYYTSPYGDCRRIGSNADYKFVYQSTNEMFYYDQTVTITVNATDLAGNVMDEYSYSFATEMHSFGQNKQVNSGLDNNDRPVTVCDSSGNIWTAWHTGSIGNRDIYIGKLTAGEENFGGTVQLTDNTNDQCNPAVALDSSDTIYVVWQDNRQGDWDIYVSTSVDGTSWSTEIRVNDPNEGNQVNPAIVIDGQSPNQAHVVWQDDRAGNQDICIAASSDGFATKTVSQITTDSFDQVEPAVTADADDTIYVVWTDGRNGSNDIYGAASNNPWTNVAIVSNANNQSSPTIAAESAGSILHLLWIDDTLGDKDIYYASSDGLPGSPLTGSSIIDDTSGADQLDPAIAVTGSTGNDLKVFACWQDWRNADTDLYFAELSSSSGTNVFVGDGGSSTYQGEPVIGIDEYSHPYLIWADNRSTNTEIYYAGSTFVEPVALASELVIASASSSTTVGADPQAITTIDDVSIVVPAGACSFDVAITVTKIANPQAFAAPCLGGYDFGPSGIQFSQPVTITIPYFVSESNGSTLPYWYNSLTGTLSQQGITGVQDIVISPTLHALSFKTTHFTAFYLLGGGAAAAIGLGGGGGGCSVSAGSEGNMVEFVLPYIGLVVVMAILKVRDARERKARST